MYVIFNRMNENLIKICRNTVKSKPRFMLNCPIYISICTYIFRPMDWDLFQVRFKGNKKKCFLICHTCPWRKDIKPSRCGEKIKTKQQTKEVRLFRRPPTEVGGSRGRSAMLHVTICSKYMHVISLVFYIMWCNESAKQRLQWEWHQRKKADKTRLEKREVSAENKEHSPTVQHKFWAPTHNAGYHRNLAVNRLTPGIK